MTRHRRDGIKRLVLVAVALAVSGIHTFTSIRAAALAVLLVALVVGSGCVLAGVWIADRMAPPRIAPRGRR